MIVAEIRFRGLKKSVLLRTFHVRKWVTVNEAIAVN